MFPQQLFLFYQFENQKLRLWTNCWRVDLSSQMNDLVPFSRQTCRRCLVLVREARVLIRWKVSVYSSQALCDTEHEQIHNPETEAAQLNSAVILLFSPSCQLFKGFDTETYGRLCETLYNVFCNWRKWLMSSSTYSSSAYWHRCFLRLIKTSARAEVGWNYVWNFIEVNNRCVQFKGRTYTGGGAGSYLLHRLCHCSVNFCCRVPVCLQGRSLWQEKGGNFLGPMDARNNHVHP